MTEDERKEMWKKIKDLADDALLQQQRQMLMQGLFTFANINSNPSVPSTSLPYPLSPTDYNSRGVYPYQEPEQDEQGTYYGYKILMACSCGCGQLISPRFPAEWLSGRLQSDREPSEHTMSGIHFTKRPDNPCLGEYTRYERSRHEAILVQCALSGTVVETDQGFRAQYAMITGVYKDGHWQSYQDYQERSAANSRINPYEEKYTWDANYRPYGTAYTWDTSSTSKKKKVEVEN